MTLAVNKIDVPAHAARVGEFHGLGFERTRGISAEHGRGAWDALEELVALLPPAAESEADARRPGIRIAVVGRPNVGKSSLVNRLLGEERVVVSEEPGTTRDAIDAVLERDGERYTLVDTAGLRRPGRRSETTEHVSALMTVRALERADVALLLVDADEGCTDQDARVGRLTRDRGVAALVLANKWDRAARLASAPRRCATDIAHGLRFMADAPVLAVSAKTGAGLGGAVRARARSCTRPRGARSRTAELNRWLQDAVRRHEPAMAQRGSRRRPLKFFYATQTGVRPPTFTLFCSEPAAVQPAYVRFLENRLREAFDFAGTPVRIRLRARSARAARRAERANRSRAIHSAPAQEQERAMARTRARHGRGDARRARVRGRPAERVAPDPPRRGERRDRRRCSWSAGLGAWLVSARESAEQEASSALAQTRADYLSAMGAQPGCDRGPGARESRPPPPRSAPSTRSAMPRWRRSTRARSRPRSPRSSTRAS